MIEDFMAESGHALDHSMSTNQKAAQIYTYVSSELHKKIKTKEDYSDFFMSPTEVKNPERFQKRFELIKSDMEEIEEDL